MCQFEQYLPHRQNEHRAHPSWAPTNEPTMSCWRYTPSPNQDRLTEFRQPLQVQSHLEMPGILVQLGHIQRT